MSEKFRFIEIKKYSRQLITNADRQGAEKQRVDRFQKRPALCSTICFLIEFRIVCVEILGIHIVLRDAQRVAEALVVSDFTLTQEFDRIAHIGIVHEAQDVVVGHPCFLFRSEVLVEIGEEIALTPR